MKKAISVLLAFGFVLQLSLFSSFAVTKVPVKSITLSPTSISWAVGNVGTIKATVAPSTATNKAVSWTSSNAAIAMVDSTGKVTAVNTGSATITCTAKDGSGKKAVCKATITVPKTIAQIVTLYNNFANNTKSYKGTITVSGSQGTSTKIISATGGKLVVDLAQKMVPNNYGKIATKTFKNGVQVGGTTTLKTTLPCDDHATASTLEPSGVKSATCTKVSTGWKVFITLKAETTNDLNTVPRYHGECMDTVSITAADLKPFTLVSAQVVYTDKSTISAVANSKGLLNNISIYEPDHLTGVLKYSFIKVNAVLDGTWQQYLTFKY